MTRVGEKYTAAEVQLFGRRAFTVIVLLSTFATIAPPYARAEKSGSNIVVEASPRPASPNFNKQPPSPILKQGNAALAHVVTELVFRLEKGPSRQALAKWPVVPSVWLDPNSFAGFERDLTPFLDELKQRSDLAIAPSADTAAQQIRVRLAPSIEMRRMLGSSFCLATPDHISWIDYARRFKEGTLADWSKLSRLTKATIFIPDNAPAYLIRACLFEEIMQSLGPAGDFHYLAGSIFNDDQVHLRPTPFDFLVLKVLYDPRLKPGMTGVETTRIAKVILDDIRPDHQSTAQQPRLTVDPVWSKAFQLAELMQHPKFANDFFDTAIKRTALMASGDPRKLLTELQAARNLKRYSPTAARIRLVRTADGYRDLLGPGGLYETVTRLDIATIDLWQKNFEQARASALAALPILIRHGHETKITEALLIRDASEDQRQRTGLDVNAKSDTQAWSDYALGKRIIGQRAPATQTDRRFLFGFLVVLAGISIWLIRRYNARRRARHDLSRRFGV